MGSDSGFACGSGQPYFSEERAAGFSGFAGGEVRLVCQTGIVPVAAVAPDLSKVVSLVHRQKKVTRSQYRHSINARIPRRREVSGARKGESVFALQNLERSPDREAARLRIQTACPGERAAVAFVPCRVIPPRRPALLDFKFAATALVGSLVMALVATFAPVPAQIAVLGAFVSILGGLFLAYLEQEGPREARRNEMVERLVLHR